MKAEPELWREHEKIWFDRLEKEHDNLSTALEWSLSPQSGVGPQAGLRLVLAIDRFWRLKGYFSEAATWLECFLSQPQVSEKPKLFADGLRLAAFCGFWWFSDYKSAREKFTRSLAIAEIEGDRLLLANVLSDFGIYFINLYAELQIAHRYVELQIAHGYLEQSLRIFNELGNELGIAIALRRLGHLASDHPTKLAYFQESLEVWKKLGNKSGIALVLMELGRALAPSGQFTEGRSYLMESLGLFRELNPDYVNPLCLLVLGSVEFALGNILQAKSYFEEMQDICLNYGCKNDEAKALTCLGEIYTYLEDYPIALSNFQEVQSILEEIPESIFTQCLGLPRLGIFYSRIGD